MKGIFFLSSLLLFTLFGCNEEPKLNESQPVPINRYTGPIIDMHIHAYGAQNPFYGMISPLTLRDQTFQGMPSSEALRDSVLERFEKYNIVKAMVTNAEFWAEASPGRFLFGRSKAPVDTLRAAHARGQMDVMAEMSPFYQNMRADHPALKPYFEMAEELSIPVGFHLFPGGPNYGFHLMPDSPMMQNMRTYNAHPDQLEDVLTAYPDLKLYIMHGGWPFVEEVKALMYAHPNVYVDISVLNWMFPREECYAYMKSLITAGFEDRIMYGSDQMVWPGVIDVGIETVNSADFLTLDQKEAIFFDNAARFLGMTEGEIAELRTEPGEE